MRIMVTSCEHGIDAGAWITKTRTTWALEADVKLQDLATRTVAAIKACESKEEAKTLLDAAMARPDLAYVIRSMKDKPWRPKTSFRELPGYVPVERTYSRLLLLKYDEERDMLVPAHRHKHTQDEEIKSWWTPKEIRANTSNEMSHLAGMLKSRLTSCPAKDRIPVSGGTLGLPEFFIRDPGKVEFRPGFKLEGDGPTWVSRSDILGGWDHVVARFNWLGQYKRQVLVVEDPAKVYPQLVCFGGLPDSVMKADPEMFYE